MEEIPPGFTHGLLLRQGQVVTSGRLADVLTPAWLTAAFGLPLLVDRVGDRWAARALVPQAGRG